MTGEDNPLPRYDFQAGATLLVDKPIGWTSFDVVNKIRYKLKHQLKVKKIKVGHSGTLDPLATGLLLICTGKHTKLLNQMQGLEKTYTGTILLGATTPSYDAETEVVEHFPTDHISESLVREAADQFIGEIKQLPPVFSAIKVNGEPLYKKARRGEKVEVKPRDVKIFDFQITRLELPEIDFFVHCSKGTYIRSLAHDLGQALDSGAYLTALRRTSIGDHHIRDAWSLEKLLDHIELSQAIN